METVTQYWNTLAGWWGRLLAADPTGVSAASLVAGLASLAASAWWLALAYHNRRRAWRLAGELAGQKARADMWKSLVSLFGPPQDPETERRLRWAAAEYHKPPAADGGDPGGCDPDDTDDDGCCCNTEALLAQAAASHEKSLAAVERVARLAIEAVTRKAAPDDEEE